MEKMIVRHKDFILKVTSSDSNLHIEDSYKVKLYSDMLYILECIDVGSLSRVFQERTYKSMVREWRAHNLLHSLGIQRKRTGSVDLNLGDPWYIRAVYYILSKFYFHFH